MNLLTLEEQVNDLFDFSANPNQRIRTGFRRIDELCGGPAAGEVFMILGRSYTGKSLAAQNIVVNNPDMGSIFFSLEMPYLQALQRMYSMWSHTPNHDVQNMTYAGSLPHHVRALPEAYPRHRIVDDGSLSLDKMAEYIGIYEQEMGQAPDFVVIDYLELVGGAKRSAEGFLATESTAASLKDFAKGENVPVFVVHQTNTQESPWNPPTRNSARFGGYTEADFVIGMWDPATNPKMDKWTRDEYVGQKHFNILKNRAYGLDDGGKPLVYRLTPYLMFEEVSAI